MAKLVRKHEAPGCPRCWMPMQPSALAALGDVHCGNCALNFETAVFSPPARPAPRQMDLTQGQVQCARHARNAAIASCERCGAFMCGLCKVDAEGKSLCAACFERLRVSGELESTTTRFRSLRTLGLHLGIIGLPFVALGSILGPASIITTIRGMRQDRRDGTAGETASAVIALLCGALATLGGLLFLASAAGAFRKFR
jgi:hypothetical protein